MRNLTGLDAAAWIAVGLFGLWVLPWRTPVCPVVTTPIAAAPAPVQTTDDRQELLIRQLCDKEVEALLHSNDRTEIMRAEAIVRQVNCGIERRL